ncbi:MAG: hypothetical protein U0441_15900 [Polyangiaceae bacterium]
MQNANKKLEEALQALAAVLPLLPAAERASIPRVRTDFPGGARKLSQTTKDHPELVSFTGYDGEAVVEDLDNVDALAPLELPLNEIVQRVADAKLLWLGEAYVPSLALYNVAKVRAAKDGKLAQSIKPLAEVFATTRKKSEPEGK